jgi:hypothetical protein
LKRWLINNPDPQHCSVKNISFYPGTFSSHAHDCLFSSSNCAEPMLLTALTDSIQVYCADNHLRLTGKHETQSIDTFSYGVSDRGASIRIPIATVENKWRRWLEDRRPNLSADPYKVTARIITTVKLASEGVMVSVNANGRGR